MSQLKIERGGQTVGLQAEDPKGQDHSIKPRNLTMILVTAVWFAIITGLAEFAVLLVAKYALHRYVYYMSTRLLWMAPLGDLIIFSAVATVLLLIARKWPKLVPLPLTIGIFAFLSFLSLLLLYRQLQKFAAVVLALGLAVQTARVLGSHPEWYNRLLRWSMGWGRFFRRSQKQEHKKLPDNAGNSTTISRRDFIVSAGTTIAGLALGVSGLDALAEEISSANLPVVPSRLPNVLLIVLDTVRAGNLSLYGYNRSTSPQLEQLAKNGVTFTKAVSTASWTLPSHASMFTGRFPHELSIGWDRGLDRTYPTLAEILHANGYETAGFVSNIWYCSRESGLNRGFAHYEDFDVSIGQLLNSSSLARTIAAEEEFRRKIGWKEELVRKGAPEISGDFLSWLSRRDYQRPFFAFLNYFDAHGPYLPPKPYDAMFGARKLRENPRHKIGWHWSPEQIQLEMNAYDGSIAYLDHQIGLLFDRLQNNGVLENTLVVITSDHGEEFLEHGVVDHGYSLYWPSIHVLLTMSYPTRLPKGLRVDVPITTRDLPKTILDLIGLRDKTTFPGTSLTRYWEKGLYVNNPPAETLLSEVFFTPGYPDWYPLMRGDMKSVVLENHHYIRNGDGKEELYNFIDDPFERVDISGLKGNQVLLQQIRGMMDKYKV